MQRWQQLLIAFLLGSAASSVLILLINPGPKAQPIVIMAAPTLQPTPVHEENDDLSSCELTPPASYAEGMFPININTAGVAELEQLPGIGPTRAADIIQYRETHGDFDTIDGLDDVPGIGQATLEGLRDLITVSGE